MPNIRLDQGYHLDEESQAVVIHEMEFSIDVTYVAQPFSDESKQLIMEVEFSLDVTHSVALDLLSLIPQKFRNSQILRDYVDVVELHTGDWLTKVRDIVKLLSPNTVASTEYLRNLGALIGADLSPEDSTTLAKMRKEVAHAIEWYKMKGAYQSIQVMAMIQGLALNIYDMYTNDYSSFYMVDWFVGEENENPPGLDSSYYKSPHFGLEILLNQVYEGVTPSITGDISYLWKTNYLDNIALQVERTRPVHTVPHYILLLNSKTDEFGNIVETDGGIETKVLGEWVYSTKYFDMQDSGDIWYFDDGTYFDESSEAFIKSITKWVLGTGTCSIRDSSPAVQSPALTGSIDPSNIVITDEKITFEFIVPKSVAQNGITELGLYVPGTPDKQVLLSCFPRIDLDARVELRVLVEVFRKSLA